MSHLLLCGCLALASTAIGTEAGAALPPKKISIDVREADLHNVIRLLAEVGKINIVIADDIKGKVTLNVRNVPWTEALEVVLRAKGLGQERSGNIIHIDRLDRMVARDKAAAEMRASQVESAELETVMIPVNYTTAKSLEPIVKSMLTARGKVVVDERTNVLIVTDVASSIDGVRATIGK